MGVFNPGELLTPGGLVVGDDALESSFKLLVGPLCLSITLRVKARGKTNLGANLHAELLPNSGGELGSSIGDDICWNAVESEDSSK